MGISYDALEDDTSILDHEDVLRRVPAQFYVEVEDAQGVRRRRPSSQAFQDSRNPPSPMSVFRATALDTPEEALEGHYGYGLVALNVGFLRNACSQKVVADPEAGAPRGHTYVIGNKTSSVRRQMAQQATEIVSPPPAN